MRKFLSIVIALLALFGIGFAGLTYAGADSINIKQSETSSKRNDSVVKTYAYTLYFKNNVDFHGDGRYQSPYAVETPDVIPINSRIYITKLKIYGVVSSHCDDCRSFTLSSVDFSDKCKSMSEIITLYNPPKNLPVAPVTCVE
jgi:hypothetical protein